MWNDACRWARQRLPLLAGGELTGGDRRKAERHLIGCPDCRGRLASLTGALAALHVAASDPFLAADAPSLRPALARQIRESRRPAPSPWSIFEIRPLWATAGLAAGVLAAGVAVIARPLASRPDSPDLKAAKANPGPAAVAPSAAPEPAVVEAPAARPEGESLAQNTAPVPPPSNPPASPRGGPRPPAVGIGLPSEPTH